MDSAILRRTSGLCPACRREVTADVRQNGNEICLTKHCPEHGSVSDPLAQGDDYKDLEDYYFSLMGSNSGKKSGRAILQVTFKCNMACRVCFLGDFKKHLIDFEPTLQEIEDAVKESDCRSYTISGAEATCREDLFEIIRILKRRKKIVGLITNGVKLADPDYAKQLKESGVDEVTVQFSGFDSKAEKLLRGSDSISVKLQALENLKELRIPAYINMLVAKGINEEQMVPVLSRVIKDGFIKMVNFSGILFLGEAEGFPRKHYIMPDDMLRVIEEQTGGKIQRKNAYLLKKIELAVSSFMNKKSCLYSFVSLIVKSGDGYEAIDRFLDLEGIEPHLDRYRAIYLCNPFLARMYLALMGLPIMIFHVKRFLILKELFLTATSHLFGGNLLSRASRFIYLIFSVECDPHRMDRAIHDNCPQRFMLFFEQVGEQFVRRSRPIESTTWLLWK
jgi:molybdenum cofactor biosynthesis enzyme MoaA